MNDTIVDNALRALLYEVSTWPKPGLVDPVDNSSHLDMDIYTFIDSTVSLRHYLSQAAILGATFSKEQDLVVLFNQLRRLGIQAEKTMFTATNNVNTHKGAIFSLGIVVAASAYQTKTAPFNVQKVQNIIKAMLVDLVATDFKDLATKDPKTLTAGQQQFLKYHQAGIRGQAQAGFPCAFEIGFPYFQKCSGTMQERILNTLITLSLHLDDSNLLKRANYDLKIYSWWKKKATHFFELGGAQNPKGLDYLITLNQEMGAKYLSLGGAADMLIITLFLGLMSEKS